MIGQVSITLRTLPRSIMCCSYGLPRLMATLYLISNVYNNMARKFQADGVESICKFYARQPGDKKKCLLRDVALTDDGQVLITDSKNRNIKVGSRLCIGQNGCIAHVLLIVPYPQKNRAFSEQARFFLSASTNFLLMQYRNCGQVPFLSALYCRGMTDLLFTILAFQPIDQCCYLTALTQIYSFSFEHFDCIAQIKNYKSINRKVPGWSGRGEGREGEVIAQQARYQKFFLFK